METLSDLLSSGLPFNVLPAKFVALVS
jgi:hypothetical protein